jgi:hypothetical protein
MSRGAYPGAFCVGRRRWKKHAKKDPRPYRWPYPRPYPRPNLPIGTPGVARTSVTESVRSTWALGRALASWADSVPARHHLGGYVMTSSSRDSFRFCNPLGVTRGDDCYHNVTWRGDRGSGESGAEVTGRRQSFSRPRTSIGARPRTSVGAERLRQQLEGLALRGSWLSRACVAARPLIHDPPKRFRETDLLGLGSSLQRTELTRRETDSNQRLLRVVSGSAAGHEYCYT